MRICPKCGKKFPWDRMRCNMSYGQPARKCDTATVPYEEPESEPEVETEEAEEDLREDLGGQADLIHDLLEQHGPLTYAEIGAKLSISSKRATNIVSNMVRDGIKLNREGTPRKVSIE